MEADGVPPGVGSGGAALPLAAAALDPHDVPGEGLPVGAAEAHADGVRQGGRAAAAGGARAAVARPVALLRAAAGEGQADGVRRSYRPLAPPPPLDDTSTTFTIRS